MLNVISFFAAAARALGRPLKFLTATALVASCVVLGLNGPTAFASTIIDIGPPDGSESFAGNVTILANGNFVVVDSGWSSPTAQHVGAVYLYSGSTRQLISTLTGSTAGDRVGAYGITVLADGNNFVVGSPFWDEGATFDTGASTWVNGTTGLNGVVSTTNSLYGGFENNNVGERTVPLTNGNYVVVSVGFGPGESNNNGAVTWAKRDGSTVGRLLESGNTFWGASFDDQIGSGGVHALPNGNYVILSPYFSPIDRGAITWGNGSDAGPRTNGSPDWTTNTLEGSSPDDFLGAGGLTVLTNGNYVVTSPYWNNGAATHAGAYTWGSGTAVISGHADATNSLVGTAQNDSLLAKVVPLTNGNFVVNTPMWDDGAKQDVGTVTWANGAIAATGAISATGGFHGTSISDQVGSGGVYALTNGNFVIASPEWSIFAVGAATWVIGAFKTTGEVNSGNSLVGSHIGDKVGDGGVAVLTNGNYVVLSPGWRNVTIDGAGAATWGAGSVLGPRLVGAITDDNSLIGTTALDHVGEHAIALANGNYVVTEARWDNGGIVDAGAATWGNGAAGTSGPVTADNSLVGLTKDDRVGSASALPNGNYVVRTPTWDNGPAADAGAATWGDGSQGTLGPVSSTNSLVGTTASDRVGSFSVALSDNNYIVLSILWDNGAVEDVGAVTWSNGSGGTIGPVSSSNSLVGTSPGDVIAGNAVALFDDGAYAISSGNWDNGAIEDAGAVTYGAAGGRTTGPITPSNSVLGTKTHDLNQIVDGMTADGSFIVTRVDRQIVTLFHPDLTPPLFTSPPADVVASAPPGAPSTIVTYATPAATDDEAPPTVTCVPPSGSEFPIGITTVTCTATNSDGLTATTSFTVTVTGSADYIPLAPARLADSRPDHDTVDDLFAGAGALEAGQIVELTVAGRGGVPNDAVAAALNVTVTEPLRAGYATVYPCGAERPTASNLNFTEGVTVPNAVVAKIGDAGKVCIYTSQALHLVVDVNGAFPAPTTYRPSNPARVLDTRPGQVTVDGVGQGEGAAGAGGITRVQVAGRAGVPADATAVALNVTVTEPDFAGYATVYPCGTEPPTASNLNYTRGLTVANLAITKIGDDGGVCIYTQSGTHLVADVNGYFPPATTYTALQPARLLETRADRPTIDGQNAGAGLVPLGTVTVVHVAGRAGVPADAHTVVLNVTVTEPDAPGYVTVYPCGIDAPLASNLNFVQGQTVPNAAITKVGTNGDVCIFNSQATHLVADVTGYFP